MKRNIILGGIGVALLALMFFFIGKPNVHQQ
jgi:hypothetical protein